MEEEPTQSNTMEKTEAEEPVAVAEEPAAVSEESVRRENKRDEKREKIIKRVKEVLAQRPNKANKPTVIIICYRGKKKRNPRQLDKKDDNLDCTGSPNSTQ
ncbi:Gm6760 [Phodopus roborovskii]|uniref:Gm6760 protein n=1 Tax=Phodopus roborovskii TaxID=109678 RepID=A0AAU9Z0J4_PHORO|nr:Gm6760 [Phodopus roborovskii]